MEDNKTAERKITSITMPLTYWETLKQLATLREVQGDANNKSLNAVMVEVMESGMDNARLELAERRKRRQR